MGIDVERIWTSWPEADAFSGVFCVRGAGGVLYERCAGLRNRAEDLPNGPDTAFAIASGTKLLTGLAVCRLVEAGRLALDGRIRDILPQDLGQVDGRVSLRQLLTHTSGIGDYIDEEGPDPDGQMRALYARYPVYLWERLDYYLPMITPLPAKFAPGARFGYSNAGYVLLGLAVEAASGVAYQQYVTDEILRPLGLARTAFWRADALPGNTALGYVDGAAGEGWRTNVFSLPVLGGSDGGLYTCARDLDTLWRAVLSGRVIGGETLRAFLAAQVRRDGERAYGLGVYRLDRGGRTAYYALGGDFGVDFFSAFFPERGISASALGNTQVEAYPLLAALFEALMA